MVNQEKIQSWVRTFLDHIKEISIEKHVSDKEIGEGYKFVSVENFQKNFNIEDPDLVGMLDKAIMSNNLVMGSQYWPRKMLLSYAQKYHEETRLTLINLFDETKDVHTRLSETVENFDKLNARRNKELNDDAKSFIGLRFLSLLLSYRYPDKYNPLKPSEWKLFCRYMNPDFRIPNHTPVGEQYRYYEPYIEAIREYIKDREDIRLIKEAMTRGLIFTDSEFRWMAQDVIYIASRLISGKKSDQNETSETGKEEEESNDIIEPEIEENEGYMPLEAHLEEYIMRNWDIIDFGEKLTIYREDGEMPAQQYVTDVGIIDILAKDAQGNFVVIELKRAESRYHVVGQILNYMTWVQENLANGDETVRGMVIVGKADNTLRSALRQISDKVCLKEYSMKMTLKTD